LRTRGSSDRNRGRSLGTVPKDGPERIARAPKEQSRSHPMEQRSPAAPTAKSANLSQKPGCAAQREFRPVDQGGATGVMAGGAVWLDVGLHVLDEILGPVPGAVELVVEVLGASRQVGDDETDVAAPGGGFDAGDRRSLVQLPARWGVRRGACSALGRARPLRTRAGQKGPNCVSG
jgi:hypothetical protein